MRKFYASLCLAGGVLVALATAAPRSAPGQAFLPAVRAVPVAVRVFEGTRFVPDLTLKDFAVAESGFAVEPQALFLVRKNAIERQDGSLAFAPNLSRRVTLLFRITEYNSKIGEAVQYFFRNGLLPGDSLDIQTPMGNYQLSPQSLAAKPRDVLAKELTDIVRKDIVRGGMAYNSYLRDLKRIVRQIGGGRAGVSDTEGGIDEGASLEMQLMNYTDDLRKMERLRVLSEDGLVGFAASLKSRPGQKVVYYFYQREFRPEISPNTLDQLVMANQDRADIQAEVQTLFQMYSRSIVLDHKRLKEAFADSGADFNFLFMNEPQERVSGIVMREQSEDIFKALSAIAAATGGITDSSQNPAASIKDALNAADAYYLLYYVPSAGAPRGTFMDIGVKVKNPAYRVVHRAGYLMGS